MMAKILANARDLAAPISVGVGTVAVIIVLALAANEARLDALESEKQYNAFMGECIERHSNDQCRSFWRYGRTDLGRKP